MVTSTTVLQKAYDKPLNINFTIGEMRQQAREREQVAHSHHHKLIHNTPAHSRGGTSINGQYAAVSLTDGQIKVTDGFVDTGTMFCLYDYLSLIYTFWSKYEDVFIKGSKLSINLQ